MEDLDHRNATDQEITDWCHRWRQQAQDGLNRERMLGEWTSNLVVKLNNHAIVKFGVPVTPSEAANQKFARKTLESNCRSVRVPRVYRFFQSQTGEYYLHKKMGYLVMEFVPGRRLSDVPPDDLPIHLEKITQAMQLMSDTRSNTPGPIDGGEPKGPIWAPDNRAYEAFASIDDLEAWFNRALVRENTTINLHQYHLSFCHLDLARRNMIFTDDGTIYLLDWQCAGFFPRVLEIWNLNITIPNDPVYMDLLAQMLPRLSQEEESTHWLLWCAYRHNMLRSLSVAEKREQEDQRVAALVIV